MLNKQIVLFFIGLLCTFCALSAPSEDLTTLRQAVEAHVKAQITPLPGEKIHISVMELGKHLQLTQCTQPLAMTDIPQSDGRYYRTVLVSCNDAQPWKFYITAHIERFQSVLVATTTLLPNQPITASELKLATRETSILHEGYFSNPDQLIHTAARYTITEGMVITPSMIKQNNLVMRDQPVVVIAHTNVINIRVNGKAEQDGAMGQMIRVENLSTNKTIYAKVSGPGEVSIG